MAIDPFQAVAAKKRFFVNEPKALLQFSRNSVLEQQNPRDYLIQSTTRILQDCPPSLPWASPFILKGVHRGLFSGPTSIAYLFLTLSAKCPDMTFEGRPPEQWCKSYLELGDDSIPPLLNESCGINNEFLTFNMVKACVYRDRSYATKVLDALSNLETEPSYCEWMKGRAADQRSHKIVIEEILPQQPWIWNERQYLGTVHGEIGIVTQIVLSDPSYAAHLEDKLLSLLKLQGPEGNWPVIEGREIGLVQFCHGAPGFVLSLLALRPYFPKLHWEIDASVALARKLIWERGLLKKEPNVCHGITGNALALKTPQRDHFLRFATPERIEQGVADGAFEKDADPFGLLWGEAGRAWVWMEVMSGEEAKLVLYTDV